MGAPVAGHLRRVKSSSEHLDVCIFRDQMQGTYFKPCTGATVSFTSYENERC